MATTTNYGWTTPDDTAWVKDGAAAIRTLGSSVDTTTKNLNPETTLGDIAYRSSTPNVNTRLPLGTAGQVLKVNSGGTAPEWATDASGMTNPMTTTGDTIYSSSGSTPARLGIGSTGNVLTVSGGVPVWSAPVAGGAYTLINTGGTTLTGGSITIGSIPGTYKDLYLVVSNYLPSSAALLQMRYNGSSTANTYYHVQGTVFGSVLSNTAFNQDQCRLGAMEQNTTTSNSLFVHTIFDYANTNIWKHSWGSFVTNGVSNSAQFNWAPMANIWSNTSAITSIDLFPNTGTFTSGTAYLYGVK